MAGGVAAPRAAAADTEGQADKGVRWRLLNFPRGGHAGFTKLPPSTTGVAFTNTLDLVEGEANRVLANGSGVAIGDMDGDGRPDLYFCSLNGGNRLFRNLGDMRFVDVTEGSGIVVTNRHCRGAVFADINGDGQLDLLVATTGEGVRCFLNKGGGKFTDITVDAGTATHFGSVTMALADVDGDGSLDLYVVNNRTDDIRDRGEIQMSMVGGQMQPPPELGNRVTFHNGRLFEYGEPDQFYFNDGRGHFKAVPWTNGVFTADNGTSLPGPPLDWGLTATFRDVNGDGWPDLYVCNDYWTPDRFWLNDGHGHFRLVSRLALRNTSASSMGVDFADINRTGSVDFFVVDMLSRDSQLRRRQQFAQAQIVNPVGIFDNRPQFMRNTLQKDRGDGTYAEIANFAGVAATDWSWSPIFMDVDLDGYDDLLVSAGHVHDVQDLDADAEIEARKRSQPRRTRGFEVFLAQKLENSKLYPALEMPIAAFRNLRGYRFADATADWGTDDLAVHHAMAIADLDGDGDLDLVVNNLGSAAGIYRNNTSAPRLAVRLHGAGPNTQGIGARVTVRGGGAPMQREEVVSGGRYMAGSDAELVFAAPDPSQALTVEIRWRSGRLSQIAPAQANRMYEIDEPNSGPLAVKSEEPATRPIFEDVSGLLGHWHKDEPFNDFDRQPLLPRKLSQLGPGVAWGDLFGAGLDDLVIAPGKGGALGVFRNLGNGAFARETNGAWAGPLARDGSTPLIWQTKSGVATALLGLSNYEDGATNGPGVRGFSAISAANLVEAGASATGALALADYDGDGTLDLFVGGRVIPEHWPSPASSRLYRGNGAGFVLDVENTKLLAGVGLVTGAVWSDLDADGLPDLALACEWGAIRVFHNRHGHFEDVTTAWGFSRWKGWWTGIAAGDFDSDGRMDLVVGNWGLNSPYRASEEHPERLLFGDLSRRGGTDIVECEFDFKRGVYGPRRQRDALSAALPDLGPRFPTHRAYSEASLESVLGDRIATAQTVEATTLASMIFLNRSGQFSGAPLPDEAQWAPVYGVAVADVDGDGTEDLFLAQNFFPTQPEMPRMDAGRGLLLLGSGDGGFRPTAGRDSGILVYGEQRGAAFGDFDGDGRPDLVVTQNGAATRLFHNRVGRAGLRVRLAGGDGNRTGVGAILRGRFGDRLGAAREIHAGGGYWSQDSAIAILGGGPFSSVEVRWPDGHRTETPVAPGVGEITVRPDGTLQGQ